MAIICPTVTATEPHEFREQIEKLDFADRIHIDLADGVFTPEALVDISQIWLPENKTVDIHLMFQRPEYQVEKIIELKPSMLIVQAEAEGQFIALAKTIHEAGIKVGVSLLQKTSPKKIAPALEYIDHVLIFSGDLGHFGGKVNLKLLEKVKVLKGLKPGLEIGWDGGINDTNADDLIAGGIDVLNVGGFIQNAIDAKRAFDQLQKATDK